MHSERSFSSSYCSHWLLMAQINLWVTEKHPSALDLQSLPAHSPQGNKTQMYSFVSSKSFRVINYFVFLFNIWETYSSKGFEVPSLASFGCTATNLCPITLQTGWWTLQNIKWGERGKNEFLKALPSYSPLVCPLPEMRAIFNDETY